MLGLARVACNTQPPPHVARPSEPAQNSDATKVGLPTSPTLGSLCCAEASRRGWLEFAQKRDWISSVSQCSGLGRRNSVLVRVSR